MLQEKDSTRNKDSILVPASRADLSQGQVWVVRVWWPEDVAMYGKVEPLP